jgi:putative ABC transport system permease protein
MKIPNLSIESAYLIGAIFGYKALLLAPILPQGIALILAVSASLIGGALIGVALSLIHIKGNIPFLLGSIIIIGLCNGLSQLVIPLYCTFNNLQNPLINTCFAQHPELLITGIINGVILLICIAIFHSQLGYMLAVYGNNTTFFRFSRINKSYIITTGLILSNALAGLSGYLFAQSNGFIDLNMGTSKLLLCITALILAHFCIKTKKTFSIYIPITGTICYFTLQQLLLKIGFNSKYFTTVQAIIVLIMLLITYYNKPQTIEHNELGV